MKGAFDQSDGPFFLIFSRKAIMAGNSDGRCKCYTFFEIVGGDECGT